MMPEVKPSPFIPVPICPWCGSEMELSNDYFYISACSTYICSCGARAPMASKAYALPEHWPVLEKEAYEKAISHQQQLVVRCKECQHRYSTYDCPMRKIVVPVEGMMHFEDATTDDGFCDKGKRRETNAE